MLLRVILLDVNHKPTAADAPESRVRALPTPTRAYCGDPSCIPTREQLGGFSCPFSPPSFPLCVWFLLVVCVFPFGVFCAFILLGRTLWVGAGGEGLRRF